MRFRDHHIIQIMEGATSPFDRHVHQYFRSNKALGSKDRREIGETVFDLMRWKGLLEGESWEEKLEWWKGIDPWKLAPQHVDKLFPADFVALVGEERALELAQVCNRPAPVTIRVNTLKTTRDQLRLPEAKACSLSDVGLWFEGRPQLMNGPEFRAGLFEMQDEASQLVAALADAKPGEQVLDYCAGAGGKSLALAAQMENKGQLFLHDIRPAPLQQASRRLNRAGVQNVQLRLPPHPVDCVLVDAPCTGSGSWRRNVDMKWRFTRDGLDLLVQMQRKIFAKALKHLKAGGRVVYATCSVLSKENEEQTDYFCKQHSLEVVDTFKSEPKVGGMDGMYGVVFEIRKSGLPPQS